MNTADLSQIFLLQHTRTQGRDGPEEQRTLTSRYGCAEGCPSLPAETAPALTKQERACWCVHSTPRPDDNGHCHHAVLSDCWSHRSGPGASFHFPVTFPTGRSQPAGLPSPFAQDFGRVAMTTRLWCAQLQHPARAALQAQCQKQTSITDSAENTMPVVKYPRAVEPLWHEWDGKAQKCGLRHTVYAVNGDRYTGEWLDNLKHGKGTQIWKRTGAIYSGDWKFGKRDGYGSYSIPDPVTKEYKKVYTGWWKNDKKCGYGTMFYPSGECYEGEWSGGLRSGWGRMCYGDGSVYEGQWLAGLPGGQGMLCLSNENRYEGGWKDGKKHGPGRFFYLDKGQLLEGIWVADIPKCGIMIDFGRDEAPAPTQYPIPKIELADPDAVLAEAQVMFDDNQS